MRKMNACLLVIAFLWSVISFTGTASAQGQTHLRITPGVIEIHDTFSSGTHPNLYTYTLKNSSTETKTIHLSTTGYLNVSKKKVTLKPYETTTFTLSATVPKKAKDGKRVEYVQAKTVHREGMSTLTLAAKVTYHVKQEAWYNSLFPASWANGDSAIGKTLYEWSVKVSQFLECYHLLLPFLLLVVGWALQRIRFRWMFSLYGHIIWWLTTFAAWLIMCIPMFFALIAWGLFTIIYRIIEKIVKKQKENKEKEERKILTTESKKEDKKEDIETSSNEEKPATETKPEENK